MSSGMYPQGSRDASWRWHKNNRARALLTQVRSRAKASGKEFSLTVEWFEEHLKPMRCEVTD